MGKRILKLAQPFYPMRRQASSFFSDTLLQQLRETLGGQSSQEPPAGQPFYLDLMHQLATQAGDPDADFTHNLAVGVPWGVTTPPLHSPGIWPLKPELSGLEYMGRDMEEPYGKANYPSAVGFTAHIKATFIEKVALSMVEGFCPSRGCEAMPLPT